MSDPDFFSPDLDPGIRIQGSENFLNLSGLTYLISTITIKFRPNRSTLLSVSGSILIGLQMLNSGPDPDPDADPDPNTKRSPAGFLPSFSETGGIF